MEPAIETLVRLSGERARRLVQLAVTRGVTEEALVAEALDRLFQQSDTPDEDVEDAELLLLMEAELGPLPPARTAPFIHPGDIVLVIPVPLRSELIRRHRDQP